MYPAARKVAAILDEIKNQVDEKFVFSFVGPYGLYSIYIAGPRNSFLARKNNRLLEV